MDLLQWLQKWYEENCVDEWQHFYGIKIETLDNPGWHIKIDLTETRAENKHFQEIRQGVESETNWLDCNVQDKIFYGACSPNHLATVLEIFKNWVEE